MRSHCVYFVRESESGPVKIGLCQFGKLASRVESLQSGNHRPLEVAGFIFADSIGDARSKESHFHAKFAEQRIRGEWFHSSVELDDVIDDAVLKNGVVAVVGAMVDDDQDQKPRKPTTANGRTVLPDIITSEMVKSCCLSLRQTVIRANHPAGGFVVKDGELWQHVSWQDVPRHFPWSEVADWLNDPKYTVYKHRQLLKAFGLLNADGSVNEDGLRQAEDDFYGE